MVLPCGARRRPRQREPFGVIEAARCTIPLPLPRVIRCVLLCSPGRVLLPSRKTTTSVRNLFQVATFMALVRPPPARCSTNARHPHTSTCWVKSPGEDPLWTQICNLDCAYEIPPPLPGPLQLRWRGACPSAKPGGQSPLGPVLPPWSATFPFPFPFPSDFTIGLFVVVVVGSNGSRW